MPSFRVVRLQNLTRSFAPLLRFATVGAVTTTLDFVLFLALVAAAVPAALANTMSYSCGIGLSYALNRSWTFGVRGHPLQAAKFVAATLVGLALSTLLVATLTSFLPAPAAKLLSVPVIFAWNYLTAHFWVFGIGGHSAQ